ncbi:hypothetical protein AeMF1_001583 [Aphanomyces euteiches]|nr:hypothetical protein AeMF1_001583 [Aphanomyces euteiches]
MTVSLWRFLILLVSAVGFALLLSVSDNKYVDIWIGVVAVAAVAFLFVVSPSAKDSICSKLEHNDSTGQPSKEATVYAFRIYSLVLLVLSAMALLVFRKEDLEAYTEPSIVLAPIAFLWFLWTALEVLIEHLKGVEDPATEVSKEDTPLVAVAVSS